MHMKHLHHVHFRKFGQTAAFDLVNLKFNNVVILNGGNILIMWIVVQLSLVFRSDGKLKSRCCHYQVNAKTKKLQEVLKCSSSIVHLRLAPIISKFPQSPILKTFISALNVYCLVYSKNQFSSLWLSCPLLQLHRGCFK